MNIDGLEDGAELKEDDYIEVKIRGFVSEVGSNYFEVVDEHGRDFTFSEQDDVWITVNP